MPIDKKKIAKVTKLYQEDQWREICQHFLKNNEEIKLKLIILLSVILHFLFFLILFRNSSNFTKS